MQPELSIPVIWTEDNGSPSAGRLDVFGDRLHFEGGIRDARHARELDYADIAAARIGREIGDRINGRPAIVLGLEGGRTLSFVGFDRPGTLVELLHRIEQRL
jgi:hypothetical protein